MRLLSPDNVDQAIEAIDTDGYALLNTYGVCHRQRAKPSKISCIAALLLAV